MSEEESDCTQCTHISYRKAKWYYSVHFAVAVALMWVIRDYGENIFDSLSHFNVCKQAAVDVARAPLDFCYGKEAVLRLAFATFIFFALHALTILIVGFFSPGYPQAIKVAHAALLPLRLILWIGLVILCFYTMDSSVFRGFFQFARVAAALFLVFQVVVLIDFVYMLNGKMVDRQECHAPLVVFTIFLFLAGMAGIVAAYYRFAPNPHCGLNIFFTTMTIILGVAATALSLSPLRPESVGLLTAMMMFAYSVYVLLSALFSLPRDLPCTPNPEYGTVRWNLVLGFVVSMAALLIGVVRMGSDSKPFFYQEDSLHFTDAPYSALLFHTTFAFATCYFVMLFTNWSLAGAPGRFQLDVSRASAWIKICTQWFCYIAYAWTLAAPKLFPGRDFGHS